MGAAELNITESLTTEPLVITEEAQEALDGFFAPVAFDVISSMIARRNADLLRIERLSEAMNQPDAQAVLYHFIEGNKPDQQYTMPTHINGLFCTVGATAHLDSQYWQRALLETDVLDYMPQSRRYEWHNQIKNPLGKLKHGSKTEYEILPLPAFEESTVRATLIGLLNNRSMFFAERVDGVFRALSKTHVTNTPEGFRKRMILNYLIDKNGSVEWSTCGVIDDLRCIIARFMGRDEPRHGSTRAAVEHIRRQNGVWQELDGGALRMRVYNGVGTAHIEVHEELAWKLNAVLAMLYPAAIPEKNRQRKTTKARSVKNFELMDKLLPFAVLDVLASMEQAAEPYEYGYQTRYRYMPNTLRIRGLGPEDKSVLKQVDTVMEAIGGVKQGFYWRFDYNPTEVVGQVVCTGAIPDHVSHQYYPTPDTLAEELVAKAAQDAPEGALWLEPSAGIGGIAKHVPEHAQLHCVEINELHTKILEAQGYKNVIQADFLEFAQQTNQRYDRIVMNPPFAQGRWQAHLEAAASLLSNEGRLVAILPASAKGKELLPGYSHSYSEVYANMFAGTSISVVIVSIEVR